MLGEAAVYPTIAVTDFDAAKKFYGETLGLKLLNENEGGNMYQSGDSLVFVYPTEHAGSNKATYAAFSVSNIEEAVEDLKSKGVSFETYPNMYPGMTLEGEIHVMEGMKMAWFKDPSGNILAIDNQAS